MTFAKFKLDMTTILKPAHTSTFHPFHLLFTTSAVNSSVEYSQPNHYLIIHSQVKHLKRQATLRFMIFRPFYVVVMSDSVAHRLNN